MRLRSLSRRVWLLSLGSLIVVMAAVLSPGWHVVLRESPTAETITGVYKISRSSAEFLRDRKGYTTLPMSELRLNKDRTLEVVSMPDIYVNFGQSSGRYLSGSGHWEIESVAGKYGVALYIDRGSGSMPPAAYSGTSIEIVGRAPPYGLKLILGDPDSGESITYERS